MTTEHAFLAPSAAARWVECAAAPGMEAAYPETEPSVESMEGTAAHWAVQMLLQGTSATLGQQAPNGVPVTQEMLEGADIVAEDIAAQIGAGNFPYLVIEKRVTSKRIHPTQSWGTPDYRAVVKTSGGANCLIIWDYKFGHRHVDAFENWQLINYAAGCLEEMGIDGTQDQGLLVDLRVIQPRAYHRSGPVQSWRVVASDLRGYFNRLANAAAEATLPQPKAKVHHEACRDCRGRIHCEANLRAAGIAADQGKHYLPLDLPTPALGLELRNLTQAHELLKARISGLEADVAARIKRGESVPHWMLESTLGRLAWTIPAAEVIAMGQMVGQDLAAPPEAITPTQAQKKGIPEGIITSFAKRPVGSAKLVLDDGRKARLTFSSSNT